MDTKIARDAAMSALKARNFTELIDLAEGLKRSDTRELQAEGHWLEGVACEFGSGDLRRAIPCYRKAAYLVPHPRTLLALARAIIRCGDERYESALAFITQAKSLGLGGYSEEIFLTLGRFYEHKDPQDSRLAQKNYAQAALRGNLAGFRGLERTLYDQGNYAMVILLRIFRLLLWPILVLFPTNWTTRGF